METNLKKLKTGLIFFIQNKKKSFVLFLFYCVFNFGVKCDLDKFSTIDP